MLNRKLKKFYVTAYSVHPGIVKTEIFEDIDGKFAFLKYIIYVVLWLVGKNEREGAQTTLHVAIGDVEVYNGAFYLACLPFPLPKKAMDEELCEKIWETSEKCVNLPPDEKL